MSRIDDTRTTRILVTVIWVCVSPFVCLLWMGLGVLSMQRLGRALERTGRNLQEYPW